MRTTHQEVWRKVILLSMRSADCAERDTGEGQLFANLWSNWQEVLFLTFSASVLAGPPAEHFLVPIVPLIAAVLFWMLWRTTLRMTLLLLPNSEGRSHA